MKLKGYYMTALAKTELGITDIIVFDVKTRAELVERLNKAHPDVCRLYDFERRPFELDMKLDDATDAATLAYRLELPHCCEVM